MVLTLAIPDEFVERLSADGGDAARYVPESFTVEEYRAGRVSRPELRRLLGFQTRNELDGFLKERDIYDDITVADVERDMADLRGLGFQHDATGRFRYRSDQRSNSYRSDRRSPSPL